ncbi:MAG: hypothetical protein RIK87_13895 [Fuerstiella sp.]
MKILNSTAAPLFAVIFCLSQVAAAEESPDHAERVRRSTAVALNYCRAALHRIRRNPEKHIFYEEQTRILNNLDLNQIEDPEVIALYKSILDEISLVEIDERERIVIREQFRRNTHRQLGTSFFVIGAQVATGQLGSAVQSGANSWWDYRNQEVRRDADQWKVEKNEFTSLMNRSSTFLDSFWRLSQKNHIPDRWLIRDQDLDQLGRVLAEQNAEQRLRMLNRMERFMECYPPYWYYVARTQQQLGQAEEALKTYHRLTEVGSGHFRQDDMLASSMANMALLQELQGNPDAALTALRVSDYSIRNWEANLVCAWVLGRHQNFAAAEELILCNLDEDEETRQSRVALASLYYHSENPTRLARLLSDEQVVRDIPIPGLLLSARLLGADRMPAAARAYLASTLSASVRTLSRSETVILAATPGWKLRDAQPQVAAASGPFRALGFRPGSMNDQAEFVSEQVTDEADSDTREIRVTLSYPATPVIHITLNRTAVAKPAFPVSRVPFANTLTRSAVPGFAGSEVRYEVGEIELDGVRLSFRDQSIDDARVEDGEKEVSAEETTRRL